MSVPANLYPGLNDIADVLEEIPVDTSRYLTLLHEIDAKCVHSMPTLNSQIDSFLDLQSRSVSDKPGLLININRLFEELMPSLEEKMHVSSIMLESLQKLTKRLELAYEVAIRNQEIPAKLRLGVDNHPAMHLHHELMEKIDGKSGSGSNGSGSKTSQALRSESRREAMVANKKQQGHDSTLQPPGSGYHTQADSLKTQDQRQFDLPTLHEQDGSKKRANAQAVGSPTDSKKRKRRATVKTTVNDMGNSSARAAINAFSTSPATSNASTAVAGSATVAARPHTQTQTQTHDGVKPRTNDYGEPLYCYCNQVAYGEMVGCDGDNCELEWFHLPCINLSHLPKGKWYCDDCKKNL